MLDRTISRATGSSSKWQPAGKEGEVPLELLLQVVSAAAEQRPVPQVEAELASVQADEVEDGALRLADGSAQASAELLQEQGGALGRSQQQQRVDVRHVDALVEEIDGEQHRDVARRRGRGAPIVARPSWSRPTPHGPRSHAARTAGP